MRYALIHGIRNSPAGNEEQVVDAIVTLLDHWILRVERADTVDGERVAIVIRRERPERRRPDAACILLEPDGLGSPAHPVARQTHLVGFGRIDLDGDASVVADRRGHECVVGRGRGRCWQRRWSTLGVCEVREQ